MWSSAWVVERYGWRWRPSKSGRSSADKLMVRRYAYGKGAGVFVGTSTWASEPVALARESCHGQCWYVIAHLRQVLVSHIISDIAFFFAESNQVVNREVGDEKLFLQVQVIDLLPAWTWTSQPKAARYYSRGTLSTFLYVKARNSSKGVCSLPFESRRMLLALATSPDFITS